MSIQSVSTCFPTKLNFYSQLIRLFPSQNQHRKDGVLENKHRLQFNYRRQKRFHKQCLITFMLRSNKGISKKQEIFNFICVEQQETLFALKRSREWRVKTTRGGSETNVSSSSICFFDKRENLILEGAAGCCFLWVVREASNGSSILDFLGS